MQNIRANIQKKCVKSVSLNVNVKKSKTIQITTEEQAKINEPINHEDNTALVNYIIKIFSENDLFRMEINIDFILEFEPIPVNYDDIVKSVCLPLIQENVYEMIDKLLVDTGYQPIELSHDSQKESINS